MAERDNSQGQNIDFSGKNVDIDVRKSASLKAVGRGTRGTPIERKDIRVTEEGGQGVADILDEEYKKQWDTVRRGLKKVAIGAAVTGIAAKAKKKSYLARQAAREEEARRQEEEYKKREALSSQGVGKEKEEKPAADREKEEREEAPEFGEVPEEEGEEEGAGEEEEEGEEEAPEFGEVPEEEGEEEGEDIMERIKKGAEERGKKEIKKRRKEAEFQKRLKELRQPEKIAPKKPAKIKAPAKLRPRAAMPKAGPAAGAAGRAAGGAGRAAGSALARAGAAIVAGGGLVALIILIIILVIVLVVVIVFYVKAQKGCDSTASGQAFCSVFKSPAGMGYGNLGGPSTYGPSGETGEPNGWEANLVAGQRDSQLNESDPRLIDFINCIHSGFPADTNAWQVTSLSDDAGFAACQGNSWTDPACAHGQWSCHYGGHKCTKSVAFDVQPVDSTKRSDIDDPIYAGLRAEARLCDTQMNFGAGFLNETTSNNHIHLSIMDTECNCAENLTPP